MFISRDNAKKIAEELKSVTDRDINIINRNGEIIGSTDPSRVGQRHMGAVRLVEEGMPSLAIYDEETLEGTRKGINLPVVIDGKTEGVIGISGEPKDVSVFGNIIKKMTEIMVQDIRRQEHENAAESVRVAFAENWLSFNGEDRDDLENRASRLKIDIRCPRAIAVLMLDEAQGDAETMQVKLTQFIRRKLMEKGESICVSMKNEIIIIIKADKLPEAYSALEQLTGEIYSFFSVRPYCGLSLLAGDGFCLEQFWKQASAACAIAMQVKKGQIVCYNECSSDFVVRCIPEYVRRNLDEQIFFGCSGEERREMLETLRLYFRCKGNIEAAAQKVYVHKNTFYYRLGQIEKRTGYSLKNADDLFLLYVVSIPFEAEK